MCVPGCREVVLKKLSRRGFLKAAAATTVATALGQTPAAPLQAKGGESQAVDIGPVKRIVDLTHTMTPDFPTFFGGSQLDVDPLFEFETDGFNMNTWTLVEHTGTHMDAPFHFSADQDTADEIPIAKLVVPLAVGTWRFQRADLG